ncbi:respiratory chain complex I subunit 1 family protein [Thermococcus sp.]|uniref:respiratory chain complex I subunit 1 family protein n=1 Tax=Thermococcus sp. TaxID=35749 RepID=UPI0025D8B8F9|nr:NADH-quinone oxidoreductase subunit H [Thermococcus sp.]
MSLVGSAINVIFAVITAPFLDGLERKVKAKLQTRQGPPLTQTWLDLIKLFKRPSVKPSNSIGWLFQAGPSIALASILTAFFFVPTILPDSMKFWGDMIAFLYLTTLGTVAVALGGFSSGSPYAQIGSHREVSVFMAEELSLAFVVAALAVSVKGFTLSNLFPLPIKASTVVGALLFGVLTYVAGARIPFDVAEAETEIVEGPLIEYSGKQLALLKLSTYTKRFLLFTVFLNFFIRGDVIVRGLSYVIGLVILSVVYSAVEASCGRFRTRDAVRFLKRLSIFGAVCWLLAVVGW